MVHLWGSKVREDVEMSRSALAECSSGDIAVVIGDEKLDSNLVYLGCQLGWKPCRECEQMLRGFATRHQAKVADNLRLVRRGRPGNEDLRLREKKRIGAIDCRARGD